MDSKAVLELIRKQGVSASDHGYQAARTSRRLKILDLIGELRKLDLTKALAAIRSLVDFVSLEMDPNDRDSVHAKVLAGISTLRICADVTPTDIDDRAIDQAEKILNTLGLMDVLVSVVMRMLADDGAEGRTNFWDFQISDLAKYLEASEVQAIAAAGLDFRDFGITACDLYCLLTSDEEE